MSKKIVLIARVLIVVTFGTLLVSAAAVGQVVTNVNDLVGIWRVLDERRLVGNFMIEASHYAVFDAYWDGERVSVPFYTLEPSACAPVTPRGDVVYSGDRWTLRSRYLEDAMDLGFSPYWYYSENLIIAEFEPGAYMRMDDGDLWEFVGREFTEGPCDIFVGHRGSRDLRGPDGNPYFPGLWSNTFYFVDLLADGRLRLISHSSCSLDATGTWTVEGNRFSSKVPGGTYSYEIEIILDEDSGVESIVVGSDWSSEPPFEGPWSLRSRTFGAYPCGTPTLD